MRVEDYKDNIIVKVKDKNYGTYKTFKLEPKSKGARMVQVLHSSMFGEINWDFAMVRTVRLIDIKVA